MIDLVFDSVIIFFTVAYYVNVKVPLKVDSHWPTG